MRFVSAIQQSIDAAAAAKKTVVYLRGIGGGDLNWYNVNAPICMHGSVRHVIGLGFGRVIVVSRWEGMMKGESREGREGELKNPSRFVFSRPSRDARFNAPP